MFYRQGLLAQMLVGVRVVTSMSHVDQVSSVESMKTAAGARSRQLLPRGNVSSVLPDLLIFLEKLEIQIFM